MPYLLERGLELPISSFEDREGAQNASEGREAKPFRVKEPTLTLLPQPLIEITILVVSDVLSTLIRYLLHLPVC